MENNANATAPKSNKADVPTEEKLSGDSLGDGRIKTFGEEYVDLFGGTFHESIIEIKRKFAGLIDEMDILRKDATDGETKRLCSEAITNIQVSSMWAVKAISRSLR